MAAVWTEYAARMAAEDRALQDACLADDAAAFVALVRAGRVGTHGFQLARLAIECYFSDAKPSTAVVDALFGALGLNYAHAQASYPTVWFWVFQSARQSSSAYYDAEAIERIAALTRCLLAHLRARPQDIPANLPMYAPEHPSRIRARARREDEEEDTRAILMKRRHFATYAAVVPLLYRPLFGEPEPYDDVLVGFAARLRDTPAFDGPPTDELVAALRALCEHSDLLDDGRSELADRPAFARVIEAYQADEEGMERHAERAAERAAARRAAAVAGAMAINWDGRSEADVAELFELQARLVAACHEGDEAALRAAWEAAPARVAMMSGPLALAALRGVLRHDVPYEFVGRFFGAPRGRPETLALALQQVSRELYRNATDSYSAGCGYESMERLVDALAAAGIPPGGPDDPHGLQLLFRAETHALWLAVDRIVFPEEGAHARSAAAPRIVRLLNARATALNSAYSLTWALEWLFETKPLPPLRDLDAALARFNASFGAEASEYDNTRGGVAQARALIERARAMAIRPRALAVAMAGAFAGRDARWQREVLDGPDLARPIFDKSLRY